MATRYSVEWVDSVPRDDGGAIDLERRRNFPTRPLAESFAKRIIVGKYWEVASLKCWHTVTKRELDAALEGDDCGSYELDHEAWVIWLQVGETEEVAT